ncbi:hypothetical protein C6P40_003610 [Pichia californica]|uniref:Rab-GAP TBC domain-containing protein n=1 Tax=Pichia californica TaxID=460514 RepID=A0A9P7BEH8_9ASCO|nr:hypothetical protein C6P42_002538 [[Candida] californica]KAG0686674.1 hypothetical protein C6P40_003610 [[Candida] californica]
MSDENIRFPSSFQPQKLPEMDPVTRIATVLQNYPSRPAAAAAILSGSHVYSNSSDVPFSRTLLWKTSLLQIDTHRFNELKNSTTHFDLTPLKQHRKIFNDLITNTGIPWHLLPIDSIYYKKINEDSKNSNLNIEDDLSNLRINKNEKIQSKKTKLKSQIIDGLNDPLSSTSSSSSSSSGFDRKHESDLDILLLIIGDVERLFPEHPQMFIESEKDKIQMIEILYRYVKWNNQIRESENLKKIGYVQGMHELCGVIYAVLKVELVDNYKQNNEKKDSSDIEESEDLTDLKKEKKNIKNEKLKDNKNGNELSSNIDEKLNDQIKEFLDSDYFIHDVFSMFKQLMSPIIDKYFTSSGILRESIVFDLKLHLLDPGNSKNPGLATALKDSQIESQLWLTRWFRMLLTRELGLAYSVRIWDGLIAYACVGAMADTVSNGHDISVLLPYVILLLILRIRTVLLKSLVPVLGKEINQNFHNHDDDTEALSLLLHYPFSGNLQSISRATSIDPESDDYDIDIGDIDDDIDDDKPIMMYRKKRGNIDTHLNNHENPFEKAIQIPKMPLAVDLFSDAAHICGLSDTELTNIGPSLINKYSNGDIYQILNSAKKNKQTAPFIDNVLKRTKAWRSSSPSSNSIPTSNQTLQHNNIPSSIDLNRTRLEQKLQKRVQNRLRDRSHSSSASHASTKVIDKTTQSFQ